MRRTTLKSEIINVSTSQLSRCEFAHGGKELYILQLSTKIWSDGSGWSSILLDDVASVGEVLR